MPSYDASYQWSSHLYGLIEDGERQSEHLAVCVEHQGRHPWYLASCQAIPAGLGKRERHAIYARSVPRQPEPEPAAVDVEGMAQAFLAAIRAARQDRQPQQAPAAPTALPVRRADQGEPMPEVLTAADWGVPVVRPDDGPA